MNNLEEVIIEQNRHQFIYGYNNLESQLLIEKLSNSYSLGNNIFGHKLSKGSVEELVMRVEYVSGSL